MVWKFTDPPLPYGAFQAGRPIRQPTFSRGDAQVFPLKFGWFDAVIGL